MISMSEYDDHSCGTKGCTGYLPLLIAERISGMRERRMAWKREEEV
jgi:hypothetical protein